MGDGRGVNKSLSVDMFSYIYINVCADLFSYIYIYDIYLSVDLLIRFATRIVYTI